jgi:signal transduction histidine kinase
LVKIFFNGTKGIVLFNNYSFRAKFFPVKLLLWVYTLNKHWIFQHMFPACAPYFHQPFKRLFTLTTALWFCGFSLAQQGLSDAFDLLKQGNDSGKYTAEQFLTERNKLALTNKDLPDDTLIYYHKETLALCAKSKYKKQEIDAFRIMGLIYDSRREYDIAETYLQKALQLAEKANSENQIARIHNNLGGLDINRGNYAQALQYYYKSLAMSEKLNDKPMMSMVYNNLANVFYFRKDLDNAVLFYRKAMEIDKELKDSIGILIGFNNLGELFLAKKELGPALENLSMANQMSKILQNNEVEMASLVSLGELYFEMGEISRSDSFFSAAIEDAKIQEDPLYQSKAYLGLAKLRMQQGMYEMADDFATKGILLAKNIGQKELISKGYLLLSENYAVQGKGLLAYESHKVHKVYADSLLNLASERAAAAFRVDYEKAQAELKYQRKTLQQQWLIFSGFASFLTVAIIALMVNRNRARAKKANEILNQKNIEIEEKRASLQEALTHLKATQNQLIQSEKMASLGELTAGIAHEIQNPLNFVNNLSDINRELLEELEIELAKPEPERDIALIKDCIDNLEKNMQIIFTHGKRADGIVKSMLYHSRNAGTAKERVDINELCKDYLKLSYQSMRSKEKSFTIDIQTQWDENAGSVYVIPQELGRVLLNLCNNAFHALALKVANNQGDYTPVLKMSTIRSNDTVVIEVEDNGPGIDKEHLSKIFLPFFTTKPTGEGTGLGLSISYDIITKGHGGQFLVSSDKGQYTKFTIILPID